MALTSSNSYDSEVYTLLAVLALDLIGHVFGLMIALTALCKRCGTASFMPFEGGRSGSREDVMRQKRIGMNLATTQLWSCACAITCNLTLLFVLLEYVGFRVIYGRNLRENWTALAIVIRLIAVMVTFWFRSYDRPPANLASNQRLQCLNNNAWTMWLVGSVMTASLAWMTIHSVYVLYNPTFCKDSGTGIMCSNTASTVPLAVTAAVVAAVYSMFASVLSDHADLIAGSVGDGDLTPSQSRYVQEKKCESLFISFIGIFTAMSLAILAIMGFYPLEYDADSRFESAGSGKTGTVLHLFFYVFLFCADFLYLIHVIVPWRSCRQARSAPSRNGDVEMVNNYGMPAVASLAGLGG